MSLGALSIGIPLEKSSKSIPATRDLLGERPDNDQLHPSVKGPKRQLFLHFQSKNIQTIILIILYIISGK